MEGILKIIDRKKNKPQKNIHSESHYWADVMSRTFGERKKFAMYLGIIKRIGLEEAKKIFLEIQDSSARDPGKLFLWKTGPKRRPQNFPSQPPWQNNSQL